MPRTGLAWTLWAAAALAVVGGVVPFVFGGTDSRIDSVIVPFWIGAALFAACAFLPNQSRGATALLYFIGGLAIVYGLLSMFSLPVRLAVLGTCPAPPAPCTSRLPAPLTNGENTGLGVAAAFGILAIFLGFYGLVTVYRKSAVGPSAPPTRKIPPVAPIPPPLAVATPSQAAPAEKEEEPELPPHEEDELPETHEPAPPHESTSNTT